MNFNSNYVVNLNLLPKGELFLISHSIRLQSLVHFGAKHSGFHNLQIRFSWNNRKMVGLMNWAWPNGPVARVDFKPTAPAHESDWE
jgi:hypothetical protein